VVKMSIIKKDLKMKNLPWMVKSQRRKSRRKRRKIVKNNQMNKILILIQQKDLELEKIR